MGKKKSRKVVTKDLNLLPVMNLFAILIPFLLSVAQFEKLGILELNLPERGPDVVDQQRKTDVNSELLNLTVIVDEKKITIGAAAGFMGAMYYLEEVEYRSKSDGEVFRKVWEGKDVEVTSPTDNRVMTPYEKETIFLHHLTKQDSADPGTRTQVVVDGYGDVLLDTAGEWFSEMPQVGEKYRRIGDEELSTMDPQTQSLCRAEYLSAYQVLAKQLENIHKRYSEVDPLPPDVDQLVILAGEDVIYDKIIQIMDASKQAGFSQVSLSLLGGA